MTIKILKRTYWVLIGLCLMILPCAFAGLWDFAAMFLSMALVLGVAELWSIQARDLTMSKRFWAWSKERPLTARLIIGFLIGGWVIVMLHLAAEVL